MYLTSESKAVKSAPLRMPPNTSITTEPPKSAAMATPTPTASSPATNEAICMKTQLSENTMPKAAPHAAPASTPNRPGDTSGLRNTP